MQMKSPAGLVGGGGEVSADAVVSAACVVEDRRRACAD